MIERPQWYRPSAAERTPALLCLRQALFGSLAREAWKASTDPCDGFELYLVSDLRMNQISNSC